MTARRERVTVISVTHNGDAVIGSMLASLPAEVPLVVVDNASQDNTLEIARRLRPDAKIHRNPVGLGYGNAMNLGPKDIATEFALLINPDGSVELSRDVEMHKRRNYGRRDREAPPERPVCAESLSGVVVLARTEVPGRGNDAWRVSDGRAEIRPEGCRLLYDPESHKGASRCRALCGNAGICDRRSSVAGAGGMNGVTQGCKP